MHEILRHLGSGARVLDLGSRGGSFPMECCPRAFILRLDNEYPVVKSGDVSVQADAASLPLRDASFDAVIANHVLEHTEHLSRVLQEIGRILRPQGTLYVAVPDASTISDQLYRWVYHGGGHINAFRRADRLAGQIAQATKLPHAATRLLHSSFSFLERRHFQPRPPRRLWIFAHGSLTAIVIFGYILRLLDRRLRTRMSVYGWAFYFGNIGQEIESAPWTNVCASCGAGHSAISLTSNRKVSRRFLIISSYHCPNCGAWNLFTNDNL